MVTSPQTWGPLTWGVLVLGASVVLACFPIGVSFTTLTFSTLGLVALSDDQRRETANRWREALAAHQISITKAALYMNWDVRELERALAGERKFDLWRTEMLPVEVRQTYALLTLRDLDVPEMVRTFLKARPHLQAMKEGA